MQPSNFVLIWNIFHHQSTYYTTLNKPCHKKKPDIRNDTIPKSIWIPRSQSCGAGRWNIPISRRNLKKTSSFRSIILNEFRMLRTPRMTKSKHWYFLLIMLEYFVRINNYEVSQFARYILFIQKSNQHNSSSFYLKRWSSRYSGL